LCKIEKVDYYVKIDKKEIVQTNANTLSIALISIQKWHCFNIWVVFFIFLFLIF